MLTKQQTALWKRWIKALESRKYKQAQGWLQVNGKFCCLGVACDLVKNHPSVNGKWVDDGSAIRNFDSEGGRHSNTMGPPECVQRLFGFEDDGGFKVDDDQNIAHINDISRSRKGPYSNVLPHIKRYFEANKFVAPKTKKKTAKAKRG